MDTLHLGRHEYADSDFVIVRHAGWTMRYYAGEHGRKRSRELIWCLPQSRVT